MQALQKHKKPDWGRLSVMVALGILIVGAIVCAIIWNEYWYREDNAKRREPMENLAHFHHELKAYLSTHEGRYPTEQGVYGLAELVVLLSDLRVKDDKFVGMNPDYLSEDITSYAYVASGLSEQELDGDMPVIFEKPRLFKSIRVLLGDGRVEVLEHKRFKNCRQVVEYYRESSKSASSAWETLLHNADYYNLSW